MPRSHSLQFPCLAPAPKSYISANFPLCQRHEEGGETCTSTRSIFDQTEDDIAHACPPTRPYLPEDAEPSGGVENEHFVGAFHVMLLDDAAGGLQELEGVPPEVHDADMSHV